MAGSGHRRVRAVFADQARRPADGTRRTEPGAHISSEDIYANASLAVASVDGVTFRLHHRSLVLVHMCAYCWTGHFESPKISSLSDLGYALSAWRPLHEDCEDYSSEETQDF